MWVSALVRGGARLAGKCVSTCVCLACQESSLPPTITWQDLQLLNEPFNACYWHFLGLFAVNVILTLLRESPTMMCHLVNWCTHCERVGWDTWPYVRWKNTHVYECSLTIFSLPRVQCIANNNVVKPSPLSEPFTYQPQIVKCGRTRLHIRVPTYYLACYWLLYPNK